MESVVDNDLVLKAVSYGLVKSFWPAAGERSIGILGAARYVVGHEIDRASLNRGAPAAQVDLAGLLDEWEELEPTELEVELAAEIELFGQEQGLALDSGESLLAAIVVVRDVSLLETGDKRAITGLEEAARQLDSLSLLHGRVRCLEQIARRAARDESDFRSFSASVCAEPGVDKSLSICFGCFGGSPADHPTAHEALEQYIGDLRGLAPQVLAVDD